MEGMDTDILSAAERKTPSLRSKGGEEDTPQLNSLQSDPKMNVARLFTEWNWSSKTVCCL